MTDPIDEIEREVAKLQRTDFATQRMNTVITLFATMLQVHRASLHIIDQIIAMSPEQNVTENGLLKWRGIVAGVIAEVEQRMELKPMGKGN